MRTLKLPDGRLKVLVQALTKAKIKEFIQKDPFFKVRLEVVEEQEMSEVTVEVEALMRTVREQTEKNYVVTRYSLFGSYYDHE
jgi:ATP-dependent Lon protease